MKKCSRAEWSLIFLHPHVWESSWLLYVSFLVPGREEWKTRTARPSCHKVQVVHLNCVLLLQNHVLIFSPYAFYHQVSRGPARHWVPCSNMNTWPPIIFRAAWSNSGVCSPENTRQPKSEPFLRGMASNHRSLSVPNLDAQVWSWRSRGADGSVATHINLQAFADFTFQGVRRHWQCSGLSNQLLGLCRHHLTGISSQKNLSASRSAQPASVTAKEPLTSQSATIQ